jgi:hypothetical protein
MRVTVRRGALLAGGLLLVVFVATLAPSVTFWDAGEFIAAARTFGIPHPPGTPLFIALLNTWARLFRWLPFAVATNLFSAVSTAGAGALTALWIGRATRSPAFGAAGAITAGTMSTVWSNATETEVYAASLCLAVAAIVAADRAGRSGDRRWSMLAAYLLALSLPLHLSALVAAPVVILLATDRADGVKDWSAGLALTGVSVAVAGLGRLSPSIIVAGLVIVGASPLARRWGERDVAATDGASSARRGLANVTGMVAVSVVACSALLIMLVRARHDPAINQADPATLGRLAYTIGRRQYDVQGLWPRQAPWWLQIANWFEYADWQFALSLAPTVIPSVWRILITGVFALLAVAGARAHFARDGRTARAVLMLFVCGSLGVAAYLNLKAGTSFGWGFVPNDAQHEARDRDYFFVLGFWAWGVWAGMGAVAVARRVGLPAVAGVVVAALPIALNWSVVDRRSEPEATMPREVAYALLDPVPPGSVLFVAGDNDTYPLWYAQQVEHRRVDVTVVTMPLLGAPWYVAELARRSHLKAAPGLTDPAEIAADLARSARALGRPVAVALTVPEMDRSRLSQRWRVVGLSAIDETLEAPSTSRAATLLPVVQVDTPAVRHAEGVIESWRRNREAHPAPDPEHEYFLSVLECPRMMLGGAPSAPKLDSLASICNVR